MALQAHVLPEQNQFVFLSTSNCPATSHTGAAISVTKIDIQLTKNICNLADSITASAPYLCQHRTPRLLGPATVILILLRKAKPKLPNKSRQGNRWQPCYAPNASLHSIIDLQKETEESAGSLTFSYLLKTIQDHEDILLDGQMWYLQRSRFSLGPSHFLICPLILPLLHLT